ncbi:MAG: bacillithiol biosynthesis cysteine-adding enzyme BshC, partial [candidate division Zixibacteria bacterium]
VKATEQIDRKSYQREELVSIIRDATHHLNLPEKTKDNIKKLGGSESLVVFAGQQVGMLLGPMYTVIKALTAYKLASKLESELGRPVVPCFWMATDDHDFEEIKNVRLLNRAGECISVSYEPVSLPGGAPMADVFLDDKIEDLLRQVEENLLDTEFKDHIRNLLGGSYVSGRRLPEAFAVLFNKLMEDFGIVPIDPNYPGLKKIMAPVFRREIENHDEIFEHFEKQSLDIISAGRHRQVHKTGDSLNLFVNRSGRRNIVVENRKFRLDGHNDIHTREQLLEMLDKSPEEFSPNVCLRPIAQCLAFPTVCQVVGPSEAAYFAQIQPLFNYLEVPWPVVKPRMFVSLVEPHIQKIFKKLSLDFASLYDDTEHEISRAIKEKFPPETQQKAESLRSEIDKPLRDLLKSLENSDSESGQAIEHARKRIDHELNHLSKKLFAAHKKRHETVKGQIYRAAKFLFPDGKFQERVLSPVYFANKFGPGIFKEIESKLDIDSVDHQIIEIKK